MYLSGFFRGDGLCSQFYLLKSYGYAKNTVGGVIVETVPVLPGDLVWMSHVPPGLWFLPVCPGFCLTRY